MNTAAPLSTSDETFDGFTLVSFGKTRAPGGPMQFGFQVDIVPEEVGAGQVVFGLLCQHEGATHARGFAVRVDLSSGEIWDLINHTGIIGWIEQPELLCRYTQEEPMLMSWQVEHTGGALIPKLQIADEQHLYPSLRYETGMIMTTVAGTDSDLESSLQSFLHPAVWQEIP